MQDKILRITPTTLIVGIDVAKKEHWCRITDYRGVDLVKPFKINNNINGFEGLIRKIITCKEKNKLNKVIAGMEPSGHYWKALGWYLKLNENIEELVGVNPYHVKQSKELDDNSPTKSDKKDAQVIARLIRDGRFFDMYLPEDIYAELRILTNTRSQYLKKEKSAKCALIAVLDEYFPEYEKVFKNLLGKTSIYMLKNYPFPKDIINLGLEKLAKKIYSASNGKEGIKRAKTLYDAALNSVGVREGIESARLKIECLLDEIEFIHKKLEKIEKAMEEKMKETELNEYFESMKGIGPIISAVFIGEIGDISRFDNWKQIRKLAGLNLSEQSSGQHKGKTKVTKRGRPMLRNILYLAGVTSVRHNPEMRQLYYYLMNRPSNRLAKNQALVAVGLKVMRIMFYMAKNKEKYNPKKALGEVRLKQIQKLLAA
ncbi:IS110 family transposase [Caloranaerobacter azorensis]|nr:IS110 family transposase [Caloranaerobacter azorensis]